MLNFLNLRCENSLYLFSFVEIEEFTTISIESNSCLPSSFLASKRSLSEALNLKVVKCKTVSIGDPVRTRIVYKCRLLAEFQTINHIILRSEEDLKKEHSLNQRHYYRGAMWTLIWHRVFKLNNYYLTGNVKELQWIRK